MLNYICADLRRILTRISHMFTMALLFFIFFAALYFPNTNMQVTSVGLVSSSCTIMDWLLLLVGLFEMIAVFSEDFKVKTMQVAIGLGLSRTKVVLCKLIEIFVLLVLDSIVFLVLLLVVGMLLGVSFPIAVLMDLIIALLVKNILGNVVYISLTMIVLFVTQSTILSMFIYLLAAMGIVNILLSVAPMLGFDIVEKLRLTHFTLAHMVGAFHSRLTLGTFDFGPFLGILIYMGVGIVATCKLFGKRELDF